MLGLLGKKVGMTQIFDKDGKVVPVTVIEAGPCFISQIKTVENDGYNAIQIGFGKNKNANSAIKGHFKKSKINEAKKHLRELGMQKLDGYSAGQELNVSIFKQGEKINISGTSLGKGNAGTVKRWHFGRGPMSHGSKSHRLPGSIGAGTTPGRVFKGTKMSGRMGFEKVTIKNLKVVQVEPEKNLILVKGPIPGPNKGLLLLKKTTEEEKGGSKPTK